MGSISRSFKRCAKCGDFISRKLWVKEKGRSIPNPDKLCNKCKKEEK